MIGLSGRRYSKKKTFDNTLRDRDPSAEARGEGFGKTGAHQQIIGGAGKWEERH